MEGFTLKCNKCGEQVIFNKPRFYSRQWDEKDSDNKIELGVIWGFQEVEIMCDCGNEILE